MWTRMAAADGDAAIHHAKRQVATFYADRVLPQAQGLAAQVTSSAAPILDFDLDAF